jgi:hypothetical protein
MPGPCISVPVPADVEPSELSMYEPSPESGRAYEWVPDDGCRRATVTEHAARRCRRPRCDGRPVMGLKRSNGTWLYCAEHLYGRRISAGVVQRRRLVAVVEGASP